MNATLRILDIIVYQDSVLDTRIFRMIIITIVWLYLALIFFFKNGILKNFK